MNILLFKPKPAIQTIRFDKMISCEPLELEYLYTAINGHNKFFLDGIIDRRNPVKYAKKIEADVILITACMSQINYVYEITKKFKKCLKKKPIIILGGPHAQVNSEHFYFSSIDVVYFSNSLTSLSIIIERISKNESFFDLPGISYNKEGLFTKNSPLVIDMKTLSFPKRIMFEKKPSNYFYMYFTNCATVVSAFGCIEKCNFCFCREMNNGSYLTRPISNVIDEIESISTNNIYISDDNFLINTNRLIEFCDLINTRNIKKNFIVYGTSKYIAENPEVIKKLKNAGLAALVVGFEFLSDANLAKVNKNTSMANNDKTLALCRELDIELVTLFIIDPDWHHADFRQLANYIKKNKIIFATYTTLTIIPGTKIAASYQHDFKKWWSYDFLRIHKKPKYISSFAYYLWLSYLYFIPALHLETLHYLRKKYGFRRFIKLMYDTCWVSIGFFIKLIIWR